MTPESSPARKLLVAAAVPVALLVAVVVQLAAVNRLPLPGAAAPDLVLLFVVAVAVCTSPLSAAVTGFAGGLALDVAPPSTHYAGEYALVFCLVAWGAARVKAAIAHSAGEWDTVTAVSVLAAAVVAGEAGKAALGLLLSDPDVTGAAIKHVLPVALVYDLLLAPVAAWPVARVARGQAPVRAPRPEFSPAQRRGSVFRLASAGAAPDLRLGGTGQRFQPNSRRSGPGARRVPKLRLAGTRAPAAARTVAAYSAGAPFPLAGGRAAKLNFASGRPAGAAAGKQQPRTPGKNWLAASALARPAPRTPKSPGKGWLRSAAPSGLAGPGRRTAGPRRRSPGRGWLRGARRPGGIPHGSWYTASPSGAWLRRSYNPWRKRRQRLLRLMGVGR